MHTTDHHALAAALANHDPFTLLYDDLEPESLSVAGLLDAAVAAGRFVAHAQAFQARVFAALQRRISAKDGGSGRGCGAIESQLSASVHLPPATLRAMLADAGALCAPFPQTLTRLSQGRVSWPQVRHLLDLTSCLSEEHARAVQDRVLGPVGFSSADTVPVCSHTFDFSHHHTHRRCHARQQLHQ